MVPTQHGRDSSAAWGRASSLDDGWSVRAVLLNGPPPRNIGCVFWSLLNSLKGVNVFLESESGCCQL
jgi:hypothetical protein